MPAKKATRKTASKKTVAKKKATARKTARKISKTVAKKKTAAKATGKKVTAKAKTAAAMIAKGPPISAIRKELDSHRKTTSIVENTKPYWMICPKCGSAMMEIEYKQVKIDKCSKCQGVYFDRGELDLVIRQYDKKGFISKLRGIF